MNLEKTQKHNIWKIIKTEIYKKIQNLEFEKIQNQHLKILLATCRKNEDTQQKF